MSEPYLGEIRCFGFNFAPFGWMFCNGQLLPISQYAALFSLLGTTYGGNGTTTFALPNLQGRIPMHWGNGPSGFNTVIGEVQGTPTVTLIATEIPSHTHTISAADIPSGGIVERVASPSGGLAYLADSGPDAIWNKTPTVNAALSPKAIGLVGGSQPHENTQPYLVVNFCIALQGIFPSRN
jgi:microcystin-dependent protein